MGQIGLLDSSKEEGEPVTEKIRLKNVNYVGDEDVKSGNELQKGEDEALEHGSKTEREGLGHKTVVESFMNIQMKVN